MVATSREASAASESFHDGRVWLESAHSLELVNGLQLDGLVFGTIREAPEVLVLGKVVVAKVEFNLQKTWVSPAFESMQSLPT